MANNGIASLIVEVRKQAKRTQPDGLQISEVASDKSVSYKGLTLEQTDYTVLTGSVRAGDTVGILKKDDEFYVIAPGGGGGTTIDTWGDLLGG